MDTAGDEPLGDTGFPAVLDAIELVCAPPVLCTMPVRGSGVVDGSADDGPAVAVGDGVETVVSDGDFAPDGEVDADDEPEEGVERLLPSVGEDADELDEELVSDGTASATPGVFATAAPTPSATAKAPTRPT